MRKTNKKSEHDRTEAHTKLVKEAQEYLRDHLGFFWKNASGAARHRGNFYAYGYPGSPDIIGCYRSRVIGIECTTGGATQNKTQRDFQKRFEAAGGIYAVVRCWGDVRQLAACLRASLDPDLPLVLGYQPTPASFFRLAN